MDLEERKEFESVRKEALWFGRAFLASKGGTAWDEAKGLSGLRIAPWFDYYWGLINGRVEACCKELGDFRLETYDKKMLLKEVSGLIEAVTTFDIPAPPPDSLPQEMKWERLSVTPAFLKQHEEKLDTFFDRDIIYNAPWNEQHSDDPFVIISADNRFYRDHLLGVYTGLLETLQAAAGGSKQASAAQHQEEQSGTDSAPKPNSSSAAPRAALGSDQEPSQTEKEIKRLNNEIEALKKQLSEQPHGDSAQEDQASNGSPDRNLVYRMVLLHRLGFLDKNRWPENATQEQISNVLAAILGSPHSPAKMSTVKRYLKGLVNQDYEGKKIENKYGARVKEFLKKVFLNSM